MSKIIVSEEKFNKVLKDIELLLKDAEYVSEDDKIIKERIKDIEENPSIGLSEKDLNDYLRKRGIKVDEMDN